MVIDRNRISLAKLDNRMNMPVGLGLNVLTG